MGVALAAVLLAASMCTAQSEKNSSGASDVRPENVRPENVRLEKGYSFQQGGWTYVHLKGSPSDIGFQHGYLLAPEIADALEAIRLFDTHRRNATGNSSARLRAKCSGRASIPNTSRNCRALPMA
jgi:hypothetical protein